MGLSFDYTDACAVAKAQLSNLKNHKLETLAKHFKLPVFKHHDAREDAIACANIFLKLQGHITEEKLPELEGDIFEFKGLVKGILADDEVNYKEAYALLYWFEEHEEISKQYQELYLKTKEVLYDDHLDCIEATEIKMFLEQVLIQDKLPKSLIQKIMGKVFGRK